MNIHRFNHSPPETRAEACAWLAQLETGDLKPADIEAFREWLRRSPRHTEEIQRAARLSADLNVLTSLQEPINDALTHYRAVLEQPRRGWWQPTWAVAASLVALVALFGTLLLQNTPSPTPWPQIVATGVGEYRKIDLEDGSSIELNTDSRLQISYDSDFRIVHLLQGEALFSVAKDKSRPFVVFALGRYVEAVGTAFVVRSDQGHFEVTVTEGEVQLGLTKGKLLASDLGGFPTAAPVSYPNGPDHNASSTATVATPISLTAGQHFTARNDRDSATQAIDAVAQTMSERELARKLAWQEGLLEFSNTPLEEVIREVSRYTDLSIDIAEPELRVLAFGGLFRTGDTLALFDALKSAYNIHAEYTDEKSVTLTRSAQN